MLIKICGNCKTYNYHNGPGHDGGCSKDKTATLSPLAPACKEFNSKGSVN